MSGCGAGCTAKLCIVCIFVAIVGLHNEVASCKLGTVKTHFHNFGFLNFDISPVKNTLVLVRCPAKETAFHTWADDETLLLIPARIGSTINGRRFRHHQSVIIVYGDPISFWQGSVVFVPFDHRDGIALDFTSQLDLLILLVDQFFFADNNLQQTAIRHTCTKKNVLGQVCTVL